MPIYDCNADVNIRYKINDRIEADSPEEADEIFERRWKNGEYDGQQSQESQETFFNWGAKED